MGWCCSLWLAVGAGGAAFAAEDAAVPATQTVLPPATVANFAELATRGNRVNVPAQKPTRRARVTPPRVQSPSPLPVNRSQLSTSPVTRQIFGEATSGDETWMPASQPPTPLPSASFLAVLDNGEEFNPDTHGAVGSNHLMVATMSDIRIQDRFGNTNLTVDLTAFWAGTGGQPSLDVFDPRVLYDPYGRRWIHVAAANVAVANPGLLIGVSQTDDPTGNWNKYFVSTAGSDDSFADAPSVGFAGNWITVQAATYSRTNFAFRRQEIWVFTKSSLYAGTGAPFTRFNLSTTYGDVLNSIVPAVTFSTSVTTQFLVANWNSDFDGVGYLRVYEIYDNGGTPTFAAGNFVTEFTGSPAWRDYSSTNDIPLGHQFGTTNRVYLGDARIQNVVWRNNTLWAAQTIYVPTNNPVRSAVQWWEITEGGTVIQRGVVDHHSYHFAYPSIAVNRRNDVLIGYSRFSDLHYPSAAYSFRIDADLFSSLRPDTALKLGETSYYATNPFGYNDWGNWSATVVDPNNDTDLWTVQEYASSRVGSSDRWGTWWGRVSPPSDLSVSVSESPDPVMAGNNVTYSISINTTNNKIQAVSGVRLVNTLPAGSVLISATPSQGACALTNGVVTCNFGTVGDTGRVTATLVVTLNNSPTATNRAVVSAHGPELTTSDNTVLTTTAVLPSADLMVSATASPSPVAVSNQLTYLITVTNRGPTSAGAVSVTNTLPAGVTFVSHDPSQGGCSRSGSIVTCNLGTIGNGGQATIAIVVSPQSAGQLTNRTTVGSSATDTVPANNTTITISRANATPVLGFISDRTMAEDSTLGPISFTVSDAETPAANLVVTAYSSHPLIVPTNNIVIPHTGTSSRTITVTPALNAAGVVTITRVVTDTDGGTTSSSFILTITPINDPPALSDFSPRTIDEDTVLSAISFTIGDVETPSGSLSLQGASSQPAIVPNAAITFGGSGANRTVTVTPATNQAGTVTITVTVGDGTNNTSKNFPLTITPVNDLPTISSITNRSINEDTATGPINFTVGDVETVVGSLQLDGNSSNPMLVPQSAFSFGGSGANRTVNITPATNQAGSALITINVNDGNGGVTNTTFTLTVNPVNDPPEITVVSDLVINEDAPTQTINLTGISAGAPGESQAIGITATSSNPGLIPHPTVNYTSPATSGSIAFAPTLNSNGTAIITITATDNGASNNVTTRTLNVTVNAINDAPTVTGLSNQTINEDSSTGPLSVTIGDAELAPNLLNVNVTSSDTNLVPSTGLALVGTSATRTLTVTPAQNAFGSGTISVIVSDGLLSATNSFLLTVLPLNDPPSISGISDRTIVEDALTNIAFTISDPDGTVAAATVSASSSLQSLVPNANLVPGGTGANRTLAVTPAANQFGTALISVTARDDAGASNTITFQLTVTPVNDPPTLNALANLTIAEDSPQQTVSLGGISSGAPNESQTLVVTATSSHPAFIPHPSVTYTSPAATGTLRFTPALNSNGLVTITVTVDDGGGLNATTSRVFTVTVTNVNDPPSISTVADVIVPEDTATNLSFTIADPDSTMVGLTFEASSSNPELILPSGIQFGGSGTMRTVSLRPLTNEFGAGEITITVRDSEGATAETTFQYTVVPVNDPPSAAGLTNTVVLEDSPTVSYPFTLVDPDSAVGGLIPTVSSDNQTLLPSANISLTGSGASRTLNLRPAANEFGVGTLSVVISDGLMMFTNSITVTVTPDNDPPTLNTLGNLQLIEDAPEQSVSLTGIGAGAPNEGQTVSITATSSVPSVVPHPIVNYTAPASTGTLRFTPVAQASGTAQITVIANDGAPSNNVFLQTFTVSVSAVNDLPTISGLGPRAIDEDVPTVLSFTVSDVESAAASLQITATSGNTTLIPNASLVPGGTGGNRTLSVTPAAEASGVSMISVVVSDGNGGSTTNSFPLTVVPVNDPPTLNAIANLTTNEGAGLITVSLNNITSGAPNESQSLAVTTASSNTGLIPTPAVQYTSPAASGTLTFQPTAFSNGTATITVTVNDGGASNNITSRMFTVTVISINDPPTISNIADQSANEDQTAGPISFSIGDAETPATALSLTSSSSNPTIISTNGIAFGGSGANRTVTLTPNLDRSGSAVITITVTDGNNAVASDSFVFTVHPVADPPFISDVLNRSAAEDAPVTINFVVRDSDGDANTLVMTGTSSNPGLIPNAAIVFGGSGTNRTVTITPGSNQTGSATITLTANSQSGSVISDSFILTITNINDLPILSRIPNLAINEDTPTGPLTVVVGDVETALPGISLVGTSSNTGLVPNGNIVSTGTGAERTVTITPAANASGITTITLTANDGAGTSSNSFTLTVAPVNDPPTLNPINNIVANEDPGALPVNLSGISAGGGESQTLIVTAISSNPSLIQPPGISYTSPNATGSLTLSPLPNASGIATITVTVDDGAASNNLVTRIFTVTLNATNDPPTLSNIPDQSTPEDTPLTVQFTVGDFETAPMSLVFSATSSNPTLLPTNNISFSGSGTSRSVILLPATNQFGTANVTVQVSDGSIIVSDSFVLTVTSVNDPPTLNPIANYVTNSANNTTRSIPITGISSGAPNETQALSVTASAANTTLLPLVTISYTTPNANGMLNIRPGNGLTGTSTVTVVVSDGLTTFSRTLLVGIKASGNVNPAISIIANQTTPEDTPLGPLPFTVGDSATPAASLVVVASTSDPGLIPTNNIVLGGSGANRTVTVTPAPNCTGLGMIYLTVVDGQFGLSNMAFNVNVSAVNDPPTLSVLGNQNVPEDTAIGPIPFTIGDVETPAGQLNVTASSGTQVLIPNTNIVLGGNGTDRALFITPATNQSGSALITVQVSDGIAVTNRTFTVTVNGANDPPSITDVPDQIVNENSSTPAIPFTLSDAETAPASLTLTAHSSLPSLIPTNNIAFGGSGANRTVTLSPVAQQSGTATVTLTVSDGASTASDTFTLAVNAVNDPPTLDPIGNRNLGPNAGTQTVNLTGISSGNAAESQPLIVAASSSNPSLVPNPTVNYTSPAATGSLSLTPAPNSSGSATITVTVNDGQPQNNTVTRTFTVTINAAPVINAPTNVVLSEDTSSPIIPFTISDEETPAASLDVTLASSNPQVLPGPSLKLGGSGANRTLSFTPVPDRSGFATVTITVSDQGGYSSSANFLVTVAPVNDAPTINSLANVTLMRNAGAQTNALAGIASGSPHENQILLVTATSSDPAIVPHPTVSYTSPNTTGTLIFTPALNATGLVTVTVKVLDDGDTSRGGVNMTTTTFTVNVLPSMTAPPLRIERSGRNVLVSWAADGGPNWALQFNSALTGTNWWTPYEPTTLSGGRYWVTNVAEERARFYRLCDGCPAVYGPPRLAIRRSGANVVLSWPAIAGNYQLESRNQLSSGPNWAAVGTPPVLVDGQQTVTISAAGISRFYRLRKL